MNSKEIFPLWFVLDNDRIGCVKGYLGAGFFRVHVFNLNYPEDGFVITVQKINHKNEYFKSRGDALRDLGIQLLTITKVDEIDCTCNKCSEKNLKYEFTSKNGTKFSCVFGNTHCDRSFQEWPDFFTWTDGLDVEGGKVRYQRIYKGPKLQNVIHKFFPDDPEFYGEG